MSNLKLNHANNVEPLVASIVILFIHEDVCWLSDSILKLKPVWAISGMRQVARKGSS